MLLPPLVGIRKDGILAQRAFHCPYWFSLLALMALVTFENRKSACIVQLVLVRGFTILQEMLA
jgi:hypothetical protein